MEYRIEEVRTTAGLTALRGEWTDLLNRSVFQSPFLTYEWFVHWWTHFSDDHDLCIFVARTGQGRAVVILPLMEAQLKIWGLRFRALLSPTNHHSNFFCYLLETDQSPALVALWSHIAMLKRRWDTVLLQEIPASDDIELFVKAAAQNGIQSRVWNRGRSAYIDFSSGWDPFWKARTSKFRANLRNRRRRLERLGSVSCRTVTDCDHAETAVVTALEIEARGWKGAAGSAMTSHPQVEQFYLRLAAIAARQGWLRLSFLNVDGRDIAFDYSVQYGDDLYCLKIGYDPEFKAFSPGQLLAHEVLKRCTESGVKTYEFLGEMSVQKGDWTSTSRAINWFYFYHPGVRSRFHRLVKFGLVPWIKRIQQRQG
ncbi:MAG: hypothetical protein C0618_04765 [Desulfuromonas sp.]|nr:MAG: hypothetical protein C0618_04765 [Desulfuromonas sp.]